jgi:hypothetical protein
MKEESKKKERPVIVTTEFRGVFFGYATDTDGDTIRLRSARNCIRWESSIGGFMGLAEKGPDKNCKIGARATIVLRKVTAVLEVAPKAVKAWEEASCLS